MIAKLALLILVPIYLVLPVQHQVPEGGLKYDRPPEIKAIPTLKIKPIEPLVLQPFPYLPMGSRPNDYAPANCTWGAASMKPDVPSDWGNAKDWDDHAIAAGKTVSSTPIVGAVAVENDGYYGHVAVVINTAPGQVEVTEMNYDWHGGVRSYWYAVNRFDYIYM